MLPAEPVAGACSITTAIAAPTITAPIRVSRPLHHRATVYAATSSGTKCPHNVKVSAPNSSGTAIAPATTHRVAKGQRRRHASDRVATATTTLAANWEP
jgi:hypothetical protein